MAARRGEAGLWGSPRSRCRALRCDPLGSDRCRRGSRREARRAAAGPAKGRTWRASLELHVEAENAPESQTRLDVESVEVLRVHGVDLEADSELNFLLRRRKSKSSASARRRRQQLA